MPIELVVGLGLLVNIVAASILSMSRDAAISNQLDQVLAEQKRLMVMVDSDQ